MLVFVVFCVAFGDRVEWSFAWPGSGIACSCWALVISDLAVEVVPGVSLAVPTCSTPSTFARGSFSAVVVTGAFAFDGAAAFSEQPKADSATTRAASAVTH